MSTVSRPRPRRSALAVSQPASSLETLGDRLVKRAARSVFPRLVSAVAGGRAHAHRAATRRLLGCATRLYAQGRGLPEIDKADQSDADILEELRYDGDSAIDFAKLPVRYLGEIYEQILSLDRRQRKSRGTYYTPQPIVDYLVRETIGPVLAEANKPWDIQVLDPAMGTGHFLLAATDFIARWLLEHRPPEIELRQLPQIKHFVASHMIWGVDLDPLAVELARICLWLEVGLPGSSPHLAARRLRCGDSLLYKPLDGNSEPLPAGPFDCIVGNPPYGSHVEPATRKRLVRLLPQMRHNGDTAVGFLERASQLLGPRGRCGLIVPKPLTYSFAWRHVRKMLEGASSMSSTSAAPGRT